MRVLNGFNVLILNNPTLFLLIIVFSFLSVPDPIYKDKTQIK